jgi:molybdopterin-guanine dinucleotide biosynthesis protein A
MYVFSAPAMIAGLILAGGRGTRLGGADKAFVQLAGQPLIAHLLARLAPQVEQIAISANGDAARFNAFSRPVLPDGQLAGFGPLAGLAAGLQWAAARAADSLITVPVDTPFIPLNLAACLTPAPSVAAYRGRQHHLVAHWPVAALPELRQFLKTGAPFKVRDFLTICGARQIPFEAASDPFLNINTPDDLAGAIRLHSPPAE